MAAPMQPAAGYQAGLLMGLLTLGLAGCSEPAPPIETAPRPTAWAEVRPAERAAGQSLSGVVRTVQRASLSFEVPGRIATLDVEVGERFASGEILARLDPRSYELVRQERASEAAEAEAEASLHEAERAFTRQRELHKRDLASTAAFDAALDTARARLAMARAREDITAPSSACCSSR
ncbi:biotin/lipoyl-binding protein [Thiorhodococcus minor]|uniref:Biotin/lipoyl-binding protein n=1 Tax=Thiorhodococcus minor TaxID=57489 RepID=A0A6M0K4H1_9GAMM|nr:biotin/lipoyl-binding protein [Thiorhodococcus minor]NEV64171.1 biotin/lipoyl-binding protein [Thiorhodococcus minor]